MHLVRFSKYGDKSLPRTITFRICISKEVSINVVIQIFKDVVIMAMVLVHILKVVLHSADKVCEQHLIMDKHTIMKEVLDEPIQLIPVVKVVHLLLQIAVE